MTAASKACHTTGVADKVEVPVLKVHERRPTLANTLLCYVVSLLLLLSLRADSFCSDSKSHTSGMILPATESNYQPRPYQGKLAPDDGQWIRPAKDYASTRYSTLDQINTGNVKNLKLAFTFSTGLVRGHEAAPLVVQNTMYIVTPWPNNLYAPTRKDGAPRLIEARPESVVEIGKSPTQQTPCCVGHPPHWAADSTPLSQVSAPKTGANLGHPPRTSW